MSAAVLHRGDRSCLAEVRRLRAELATARGQRDRLAELVAGHLAADPVDQLAALWRLYARQSYQDGRDDALAEIAAVWPSWPPLAAPDGPALAELEARRWTLRGELRTRDTFADPHPHDHNPGTDASR